jgi:hypothetical protein
VIRFGLLKPLANGFSFDLYHSLECAALERRAAGTHRTHLADRTEGINLRGVFRFPIEQYAGQLLPSLPAVKSAAGGR